MNHISNIFATKPIDGQSKVEICLGLYRTLECGVYSGIINTNISTIVFNLSCMWGTCINVQTLISRVLREGQLINQDIQRPGLIGRPDPLGANP